MDYGENCGNWRLAEILSVLKEQEEYKMSSRSSNVQQLQKSFIFKVGHVCGYSGFAEVCGSYGSFLNTFEIDSNCLNSSRN